VMSESAAGHLALSQGALPLVVAVTSSLDGDYLLVRAGLGHIELANFRPGIVAFHTAANGPDHTWRQEVLVRGPGEVLEGEPPAGLAPPPLPVVGTEGTTILRVSMELVTGWQHGTPPRPGHPTQPG
jgi:hypothetical protein